MKKFLPLLILVLSLSACDTDYWWSRGQPPAPAALFERSSETLSAALSSTEREDIKSDVLKIQSALKAAQSVATKGDMNAVKGQLADASDLFLNLEQRLSVGSRPAMVELGGQLRAFQNAEEIPASAFSTFGSRVFFLLANELTVPAPVAPVKALQNG